MRAPYLELIIMPLWIFFQLAEVVMELRFKEKVALDIHCNLLVPSFFETGKPTIKNYMWIKKYRFVRTILSVDIPHKFR